MQSNEALEKLIYELQYLRGAAENIQQRIELINASLTEIQVAISTLDGMGSEVSGSSMLVPIGGGSYIRAKLDDPEKLLVGIGADVIVEKTVPKAKEDLQGRSLELEKARAAFKQQFNEVSMNINKIQREAQKIAEQVRGEAKNV
ncbi:MAG: prefoldin subunit alpha [Candidatus Bathyarchaeota archaeon]